MTAEEFFKEKPEFFIEKKHLFTHLLTHSEMEELKSAWIDNYLLLTLRNYCTKQELPFNVVGVQIINDAIERDKFTRSLFDIKEQKLELMALFLMICLVKEKKGWLCVRKESDSSAFVISKEDIHVSSKMNNSWYSITNTEWYNKTNDNGLFVEDKVTLDVINPMHGFIDIRQKIYDRRNSNNKILNSVILYYKSIKTIAEWESQ